MVWLASSRWFDQLSSRVIRWALRRWTSIDARDYARLLHLRNEYAVTELAIDPIDWIPGKPLAETGLVKEGLLILGLECPGNNFIGAPPSDTQLRAGDRLVLYGRISRIAELDRRLAGPQGDRFHIGAVAEYEQVSEVERSRARR